MKRPFYLFTPGKLHRKDDTLRFNPYLDPEPEKQRKAFESETEEMLLAGMDSDMETGEYGAPRVIPIESVDSLYVFGEITFNTTFFNFLNSRNIPMHVFNYYGFYSGSWYPKEYLNSGFLLVQQAEHYRNPKKRMVIARAFIDAAAANMLKNLRYYQNRETDVQTEIDTIENLVPGIAEATKVDELMGVEGNIRQVYYNAFPKILKERYDFDKRVKNPPDNAVNALMSFANSMVYTACLSEIYRTQLSPLISFLHEPGARRYSLALDLAEIFKPMFADRMLFAVLNKQMIQPDDFDQQMNYCYLKEKGRKTVVQLFEEKMTATFQHRKLKRNISYRRLIRLECYKLIKHITGAEDYEPFKAWW